MDGNGRTGPFLLNVMFASGGYPWTVIPVEECKVYMVALEKASVEQNIKSFAKVKYALLLIVILFEIKWGYVCCL
jgi:hypothetical protein